MIIFLFFSEFNFLITDVLILLDLSFQRKAHNYYLETPVLWNFQGFVEYIHEPDLLKQLEKNPLFKTETLRNNDCLHCLKIFLTLSKLDLQAKKIENKQASKQKKKILKFHLPSR